MIDYEIKRLKSHSDKREWLIEVLRADEIHGVGWHVGPATVDSYD